ncbi:MAG: GntR family transcriptional regulator [Alphaproteobacteria bacterium]|nr:MAG: GntR family transcriptional regulator [Alphaproteobacteria bacterium]
MTTIQVTLDRTQRIPLQEQLIRALKRHISDGLGTKDLRLPSSRALALDLGVSRIVTLTAYDQLIAEGYLVSRPGSGTYINQDIIRTVPTQPSSATTYRGPDWFKSSETLVSSSQDNAYHINFAIGRPSAEQFDAPAWKRAWRQALSHPFVNQPPPAEGIPELRAAIADLVARNRGIRCAPDDIVITSGAVDIITLMARITAPFKPLCCLENPGFPAAHDIFSRYGHDILPIGIDQEGLMLSDLPGTPGRPKLLFCTPSHQFPLGFRLSLPRRLALMDWARRHDAIILEDDYDSEFRYDVAPLPSLKAQDDSGHVIYFSSLSKSLSPAIRLGYMIAPEAIRQAATREIDRNHMQPPWLLQQAMAHFIQSGELDKHIRRMRRHYTSLNKAMRDGLKDMPQDVQIHGLEAGLHCFLALPPEVNRQKLSEKISQKLLYIDGLDRCYFAPSPWQGYAFGYGHLTREKITEGLGLFTSLFKET